MTGTALFLRKEASNLENVHGDWMLMKGCFEVFFASRHGTQARGETIERGSRRGREDQEIRRSNKGTDGLKRGTNWRMGGQWD